MKKIASRWFYHSYWTVWIGEEAIRIKLEAEKVLYILETEYYVPSWEDFIKRKKEKDIGDLIRKENKKNKSFVYLPLFLTEVLLDL